MSIYALLAKVFNLDAVSLTILVAIITFHLAHPKLPTTNYPITIIRGNQGDGKSLISRLLQMIIDPCSLGLLDFPKKGQDFAIMAQNAHGLFFDNVRDINEYQSDLCCKAATGGTVAPRKLYTDAELVAHPLHVGLFFNGIHSFGRESDFAQRCIVLWLLPFNEQNRRSEVEILRDFQKNLPAIMHHLFSLIAEVFKYYPENVEVTNPERLIDFVKWLAALEKANGIPAGIYQGAYSDILKEAQLNAILDHPLAATILSFVENSKNQEWSGTPAELLAKLNCEDLDMRRSKAWPDNPISLSKRLHSLQSGLLTQGIKIEFTRGKRRTITITTEDSKNDKY